MPPLIQIIATTAHSLFRSCRMPCSDDIHAIKILMNRITPKDLNLSNLLECPSVKHSQSTIYFPIFEDDVIIIGIFYLRSPTSVIPLHDHPGMHGFLKVLHGTACIDSYNKSSLDFNNMPIFYNGRDYLDSESDTAIFGPEQGNIHEISNSGQPLAFLDLISPPYGNDKNCTYFSIDRAASKLKRIKTSFDCHTISKYSGPLISSKLFNY